MMYNFACMPPSWLRHSGNLESSILHQEGLLQWQCQVSVLGNIE